MEKKMDAVKYIEERDRMCAANVHCANCPAWNDGYCFVSIRSGYDAGEQVKIVEEWAAAHPCKTRQDVFLEQWPEARTYGDGILCLCPKDISSWRRGQFGGCTNGGNGCDSCRREFWGKVVE